MAIPYPLVWESGILRSASRTRSLRCTFSGVIGKKETLQYLVHALSLRPSKSCLTTAWVAHTELKIQFPMYLKHDIARREEPYGCVLTVVNRLLDVYR